MMSCIRKIGILTVLCFMVAACLSQASQGGPHVSQGGAHVSQGGAHVSQGGAHQSQGGVHELQGGPQETQGRVRRQASQGLVNWVACDFTAPSKISCYDCNTRIICKSIGGILKPCNPMKPFCDNGICSDVPSKECA